MPYRPTACARLYRLVIVRKNLAIEKGEQRLFDDYRYFYYLTNDWEKPAIEIVFRANGRCNQENLNAQLKGAVRALTSGKTPPGGVGAGFVCACAEVPMLNATNTPKRKRGIMSSGAIEFAAMGSSMMQRGWIGKQVVAFHGKTSFFRAKRVERTNLTSLYSKGDT